MTDEPLRFFYFIKINTMIYKFKANEGRAYLEVQKEDDKVKISMFDEADIFVLEINKETLYDFIGALHSIQKKISNEKLDNLSNKF